jgi:BON domain
MFKNDFERKRFLGNFIFDEANYYTGSRFQIGGQDRSILPVFNDARPKSLLRGISDDRLLEDAWSVLRRNYKIDISGIELKVKQGIVELLGSVCLLSQKHEAESVLEHMPGVLGVSNQLRISKPHP